jgi:C-terminal processing protease CtpA/Prc
MRNNRNKILSFLIILTLLLSFSFALSSCMAGSEEILAKETLMQNVLSETKTGKDYVKDYLDRWDFPLFDGDKLKRVENLYKKHYYMALPSAYDLARATALHFLEHSYDTLDLSDTVKVTDAIISSYVSSIGDRYSFYRTSAQYNEYASGMSGSFVGIGVTVQSSLVDDGILVISPLNNSPAKECGILADLVLGIPGRFSPKASAYILARAMERFTLVDCDGKA